MFLPAFVYFIMFSYYPFFKGILMSFEENKLMGARSFAGFENYKYVLKDPDYIQAVINSLVIGLVDLVLYFALSLVLALCINEVGSRPVQKGLRTITYLPYLFSWSVIGGVLGRLVGQGDPFGSPRYILAGCGVYPLKRG